MSDQPDQLIAELFAEGKPQEATVCLTMLKLAELYARHGWDQPAGLWTLRRQLLSTDDADYLRAETGMAMVGFVLTPLNIPMPHPLLALRALHHTLPEWRGETQDQLLAWALVTEAYAAAVDPHDVAARDQLEADGREHRVHQRPDAVEVRVVLVVDRALIRYQLLVYRDDTYPQYLAIGDEIEGDMVDSLADVMAVTP